MPGLSFPANPPRIKPRDVSHRRRDIRLIGARLRKRAGWGAIRPRILRVSKANKGNGWIEDAPGTWWVHGLKPNVHESISFPFNEVRVRAKVFVSLPSQVIMISEAKMGT